MTNTDYHRALKLHFDSCNFDKCRADRHMPSYAKKLVDLYNQNGEIDKMLSNK